ncbi:hypothetical protein [Actinoallomurus bryophytorum]|uniref:hypothetical protein n=1 Tax=Actinoallomurus bryophytorum TaxID=1490222 RepID=UPI00114F7B9E|nr:hypothetical protein [Actinoallomurus bryophytorum]
MAEAGECRRVEEKGIFGGVVQPAGAGLVALHPEAGSTVHEPGIVSVEAQVPQEIAERPAGDRISGRQFVERRSLLGLVRREQVRATGGRGRYDIPTVPRVPDASGR